MWRFADVHAENILSYEVLDLTLDQRGITLIVGKNGSGKSTLFHTLCWVMYGETPRKGDVTRIIRRGQDACLGRVTVEDDAGRVTIERTRRRAGGTTLRVSGFDARALTGGQQQAIDARFGDYRQFTITSLFSGIASSFCRLSDPERKGLMESMVGIGRFSVASDLAKKQADLATTTIETHERSIPAYQSLVTRLQEERTREAMKALAHTATVTSTHRRLVRRAAALSEAAMAAFEKVAEWVSKAEAQKAKIAEERAERLTAMNAAEKRVDATSERLNELSGKNSSFRARIDELGQEIAAIRSGRHADMCPTCGQRWPHEDDPAAVARVVQEKQGRIEALEKERAPIAADLANAKATRADAVTALNAARAAYQQVASNVDDREFRRLMTDALTAEADLKAAQEAAAEYAATNTLDPDSTDMDRIEVELVKAEEQLAEITRVVNLERALVQRLLFWRKGFSRTGLPSFLIDSSIPSMNKTAQDIANDLTDGGLIVRFNPSAEKGTKSVFDVEVDYAEGGEGFESVSRGEQTRVDIAVLFAIRDLAAQRAGNECSQLFLDELFDGADEQFVDSCIRMLRKRYGDRAVYLISHDPAASSLCDRVWQASKSCACSTLG